MISTDATLAKLEALTKRLTQLRTQELDEYKFFWENTLGLFVISDLEYFIRINPRWTEVLGYTAEEIMESPFWDFVHPDDVEKTKTRVVEGSIQSMPTMTFTNRWKKKAGGYAKVEWLSRGTVRGYFCSIGRYLGDE